MTTNYNLSQPLYSQQQSQAQTAYPPQSQMQQFFPQSQGNVYVISNSLEVANVPIVGGVSVALCLSEGLMYIKTLQNGGPAMAVYNISQYKEPEKEKKEESNPLEERVKALEEAIKYKKGGANF